MKLIIRQQKKRYYSWLTAIIFLLLPSLEVKAQTVLDSIEETGVLKVAIREDAAPFGYVNSANQLQGYCLDFIALLESKLQEKLTRDIIAIRLLKSTVSNRFELVSTGLIDLECGPNTIKDLSSSQVTFSRPFFVAETKFLTAKEELERVDLDGDLADVNIGVIRNSSTEELVKERYPSARVVLFSGVTARNRGVQAVAQGKIAAMVSDGILLRAEAAKQKLSVDDYILIPEESSLRDRDSNLIAPTRDLKENPAPPDSYGMIIKGEDRQWQEFIDSAIASSESQKLLQQWFEID